VKVTSGATLNNIHLILLLVHGMCIAYCAASISAFTGITSFYTSQTLKSTESLVFIWKTDLN